MDKLLVEGENFSVDHGRFSLGVRVGARRGSMWRLWGSKRESESAPNRRSFDSFAAPRTKDVVKPVAAQEEERVHSDDTVVGELSRDAAQKLKGWLARVRWARALIQSDPRRVIHEYYMPGDERGPRGYLRALKEQAGPSTARSSVTLATQYPAQ